MRRNGQDRSTTVSHAASWRRSHHRGMRAAFEPPEFEESVESDGDAEQEISDTIPAAWLLPGRVPAKSGRTAFSAMGFVGKHGPRCRDVRQDHVHPAAAHGCTDCLMFALTSGKADSPRDFSQVIGVDADHPTIQAASDRIPNRVEESVANIANGASLEECALFSRRDCISRSPTTGGRAAGCRSEKGHGQGLPLAATSAIAGSASRFLRMSESRPDRGRAGKWASPR